MRAGSVRGSIGRKMKKCREIGTCQDFSKFCHIYPSFTRKRIVSLYFGWDDRTRLGVAICDMSGPPVFHIKAGASA